MQKNMNKRVAHDLVFFKAIPLYGALCYRCIFV